MELSQQVISLDLAKRLKELGVKSDALFEYLYSPYLDKWKVSKRIKNELGYSAFTVAELGEMLPENYSSFKFQNLYECINISEPHNTEFIYVKEADCRAKMLIYLLENKLMELPK